MDALPLELLTHILCFLKPLHALHLAYFVSRRWRRAALAAITEFHFAGATALGTNRAARLIQMLPHLRSVNCAFDQSCSASASPSRTPLSPSVTSLTVTVSGSIPFALTEIEAPSLTALSVATSGPVPHPTIPLVSRFRTALSALHMPSSSPADLLAMHLPSVTDLDLRVPAEHQSDFVAFLGRHAPQLTCLGLNCFELSAPHARAVAALPLTRLCDLSLAELQSDALPEVSALLLLTSLRSLRLQNPAGVRYVPLTTLTRLTALSDKLTEFARLDELPHLCALKPSYAIEPARLVGCTPVTLSRLTELTIRTRTATEEIPANFWTALSAASRLTRLTLCLSGRIPKPYGRRTRRGGDLQLCVLLANRGAYTCSELATFLRDLVDFSCGVESVRVVRAPPKLGSAEEEEEEDSDYAGLCALAAELTQAGCDFTADELPAGVAAAMRERCRGHVGRLAVA